MNIQQYYEEKNNREEQERAQNAEQGKPAQVNTSAEQVIPVVQEQATISKEERETSTVRIHKNVVEVEKNISVPLLQEGYDVQRIAVNQFVDATPPVREEGDTIIIPVVREVLVVEKRLELVEELHVIKRKTTVDRTESFTLRKEEVNIERIPTNNSNA